MTRHCIWIRYIRNSLKFRKLSLSYSKLNISIRSLNYINSYFVYDNGDSHELSLFYRNKQVFLKKTYLVRYLYKIFLKKGYSYKSLSYISSSLTKLNDEFYDKCFYYYLYNYLDVSSNFNDNSSLTIYNTDYIKFWEKSFFYFNEKNLNHDDSFDYLSFFQNKQKSVITPGNPNIINNFINDSNFNIQNLNYCFLSFHLKYFNFLFLFFKKKNLSNRTVFPSFFNYYNSLLNNSSLDLKISFLPKTVLLLFYNFYFKVRSLYLLNFNRFFSLDFFLKYVINQVFFFFKINYRALTKKIRKILKNKYRYKSYPTYIKPSMRIKETLRFLKKCVELEVCDSLRDNMYQSLFSIIFEHNDSWIIKLRNKQQLSVLKSFSKTK